MTCDWRSDSFFLLRLQDTQFTGIKFNWLRCRPILRNQWLNARKQYCVCGMPLNYPSHTIVCVLFELYHYESLLMVQVLSETVKLKSGMSPQFFVGSVASVLTTSGIVRCCEARVSWVNTPEQNTSVVCCTWALSQDLQFKISVLVSDLGLEDLDLNI